jgi:hypothetical protein
MLRLMEQRVTRVALEEWAAIPLEHRAGLDSEEALVGVFGRVLAVSLACVGRHQPADYRQRALGWDLFTREALRRVRVQAREERETLARIYNDTRSDGGALCSHIRPDPE